MADSERSLLVLGLGNLLCADDGLGVHAVHSILERYEIPDTTRVLDGGTLGLSLLSCFDGADDVILIDAIAADGPAGTLVRLEGDEVAPAVRNRLSCHQIGVADLLDALELLESYPERVILCGIVPESLELDTNLSPRVAANLPHLIDGVVAEAARLGFEFLVKKKVQTDGAAVAHGRLPAAVPRGL
ncbi:MAG: hydrogenase maturation protease [bacterium]|nr:hydrogenase maturation protease [bacterium]